MDASISSAGKKPEGAKLLYHGLKSPGIRDFSFFSRLFICMGAKLD